MERKRELVKGENLAGQEIEVAVVRPGSKVMQDGQMEYNRKVATLIREGQKGERLLLRSELDKHLEQLGVWIREDAMQYLKTQGEIGTCVLALRQGGMKLSEGRELALHVADLRSKLLELYAKRSQLDGATIEAVAENHKFDFLVSQCVVHADTGGPYFADLADYVARKDEPVAAKAAAKLAQMVYGYDTEYLDKLPEQQWLKQYGFVNAEGRLTNRKGQLVDRDGRAVNENGQWIDEQGNPVDRNGRPVTETGEAVVEPQPFVDDETGDPVSVGTPESPQEPKPKKRRATKKTT
jgi:hypothetical protein